MMSKIIDGELVAKKFKEIIKKRVVDLKESGASPTLATVLVGDDPGSQKYVKMKERDCQQVGISSLSHNLQKEISETELIQLINKLNLKKDVYGILVQLPLPKHIDEQKIIYTISPDKDVDGLHPYNMGKLMRGEYSFESSLLPCTPKGIMELLAYYKIRIEGKHAVVVGRSVLVGGPMSKMLLDKNATVTVCHSRTVGISEYTKQADILISAVGRPPEIYGETGFKITKSMVKKGAVVIGTGVGYLGKESFFDIDFNEVRETVSYLTPKFGSVGPMTRAMLLKNTIIATQNIRM
ncbi:MAG: bifunctional 5,10-methylenetetrahydrofolate dehydrogenase/5,10-methenyltetrahydrofolate cyclohydrolase [Candidatus Methylarchaceae archaeon HK02M2]|nr:bifunctional 5,10-methylenetetrahydrofolate dehydrogenase/5,10-methenyltetrahydrofolate cyclohydrolase [Candidatus Methylarchaceae archaeon HK02M2]